MNNIKQFTYRDGLDSEVTVIKKKIELNGKTIEVDYVKGAEGNIIKLGYEVDDAGIGYPIFIDDKSFYVNNNTGVYEIQNEGDIDFVVNEILVPRNLKYTLTYATLE